MSRWGHVFSVWKLNPPADKQICRLNAVTVTSHHSPSPLPLAHIHYAFHSLIELSSFCIVVIFARCFPMTVTRTQSGKTPRFVRRFPARNL
jgi:hypothetical protein